MATTWSKWHEGHLRSKPRQVGASGAQCVADAGVPRWVPVGWTKSHGRMAWDEDPTWALYIYIYILISLYSTLYIIYIYIFISSYHWCSNWEKHQWMDHEDFPLPCLIVGSYGANGARSKCATKCDTSLQLLPQHVSINSVRWYANQVMYLCMSVSVCLHACM